MKLVSAAVGPFKSINSQQTVSIEESVTVFVGMNEAGKTVFLQALAKSNDALGALSYNPVDDYPRKDLSAYLKRHKVTPESAVVLTYRLSDTEVTAINTSLPVKLPKNFQFSVTYLYDNTRRVSVSVDETQAIAAAAAKLSSDAKAKATASKTFREIPSALAGVALTDADKPVVAAIGARIAKTERTNVIEAEAWAWLDARIPKFLYFSDYDLLPSKSSLARTELDRAFLINSNLARSFGVSSMVGATLIIKN